MSLVRDPQRLTWHRAAVRYGAVALGAALIVFAGVGFLGSQTASGRSFDEAERPGENVRRLDCQHSGGLTRVLGPVSRPIEISGAQVFHVEATAGGFRPNNLYARAGMPIELRLSVGEGCSERITFDVPAASASLARNAATLRLQELEPGPYPFKCDLGQVAGVIVVR